MASNAAQGSMQGLIDVHHHIVPPFYLEENRDRIAASRGGRISPAWLEWTPEKTLSAMDQHNVATSVISLSTPGVWFGDVQQARDTSRRCNEYAADLARRHAGRFGRFATVALPDIDGTLREIEYALDVLGADGVGLLTSYSETWLGDPSYDPVFAELNRRKAVVFVHPTTPTCCQNLMPNVAPLIAEVPQDTARAIINLVFSGTLNRCPDIRFIFTHAGGTLPMIAGRMPQYGPPDLPAKAPHGVDYELKRLNFDIAATTYRPAIAALRSLVPITQVLLGSDHPYVQLGETVTGMAKLDFTADELRAVGRDNALRLLPQLASA
jgi:predicted TIM-barrel fold metal-dependent hydrolase